MRRHCAVVLILAQSDQLFNHKRIILLFKLIIQWKIKCQQYSDYPTYSW